MTEPDFQPFSKIPRLRRNCVITEKIDGSNGQLHFDEAGVLHVGSRNRWLQPGKATDNFGFAAWAYGYQEALFAALGPGRHFGEWWGVGIQRGYGLHLRRFSLFNPDRYDKEGDRDWGELTNVGVVPTLHVGPFSTEAVDATVDLLRSGGSLAAPGFGRPEGVVVFHVASRTLAKVTLEGDDVPKSQAA